MSRTYAIGAMGRYGFEEINNGSFANKAEARKAAAELARMWASDSEDGIGRVAIVVSTDDDRSPDMLTVATADRGRKTVRWS